MTLLPIRSHSFFLSEFLVDSNLIDFIDFIDNTTYIFSAFEPIATTQQILCYQMRVVLVSIPLVLKNVTSLPRSLYKGLPLPSKMLKPQYFDLHHLA